MGRKKKKNPRNRTKAVSEKDGGTQRFVQAAFLWPDTEKALKSRAFGQNEKVGNFYQNYLPFVAESKGFEPLWRCRLTVFKTAPL